MQCPRCQKHSQEGAKFCGFCGAALLPAVPPQTVPGETPPTSGPEAEPAPVFQVARSGETTPSEAVRESERWSFPWSLVWAFGGAGLAFLVYWFSASRAYRSIPWPQRPNPAIVQFQEALHQGRLVTPWDQSAYDIYLKLKNDPQIKPEKLQELLSEVTPRLIEIQRSVFQKWRGESKLDTQFHRWAEFCRLLEWLSSLDATYVPEYYYCQGQAAFEEGNYDRALTFFQQALQHRPDWALALNGIGKCYVRKKDWPQAERYYRQAAAADPTWVYPVANLAGLYWRTKRYAEAEQMYLQALQLAPTKPYLYYSLGHVYLQTQRRPQACTAFRNALKYSQDPPGQTPEDLGFDPEVLRRQMSRWGC